MTQIALQLYTLRSETEKDLLGVLRKVAQVGYDGVEFAGFQGVRVPEVKQALDDFNLQASGGHFSTALLEHELDQVIADAQALGMPTVGCPGFWGVDYEDEAVFHGFAELFNKVGEACQAANLTFLYHVHGHEFVQFGDRTGMDILINETQPEFMSLQPDVFWVQRAGIDPAAFVQQHNSRIAQLHMKDAKDETWQDTEVGDGMVNTRGALAAATNVDWLVVEQEGFDKPMYESIGISLRNLKAMLAG